MISQLPNREGPISRNGNRRQYRARSSVGQSSGLIIHWSQVRGLPGALSFKAGIDRRYVTYEDAHRHDSGFDTHSPRQLREWLTHEPPNLADGLDRKRGVIACQPAKFGATAELQLRLYREEQ